MSVIENYSQLISEKNLLTKLLIKRYNSTFWSRVQFAKIWEFVKKYYLACGKKTRLGDGVRLTCRVSERNAKFVR